MKKSVLFSIIFVLFLICFSNIYAVSDTTAPSVTISKPSPASVYVGDTVKFTVYFDDETDLKSVNLNASNIILNGFTATLNVSGSNNVKVVTLVNVQGAADSDNYITVKAGTAIDTSGNKSIATNSSKFTMSKKDTTVPTVTISKPSPTSVYIGDKVTYTVSFSDETGVKAVNFTKDYVTLNGFTATVSVSGSGTAQRTVTLTNVQGAADSENYITVKAGAVTDTSGNTSKAVSSSKFTMSKKDTTVPTVTISRANPTSVYIGDKVTYTVYFDDDTGIKAVNFTKDYVTLNGFTATVSVSGSGTAQRTVTLTNVQGAADSENYITVKAGAVTDTSGNTSKAVSSSKFTMSKKDTTVPTVTISKPSPESVYIGGTVAYNVYFDDETGIKAVNFNKDYVKLNGFTATVSVSGTGNERRTVTLTNVQGSADSDNYITVKAGAVTDTSGNTSKAVDSARFTMNIKDTTPPTIAISKPNPTSVYIGDKVTYTVYFDDETGIKTVNFTKDYVTLNGFTATVSVSGTGNERRTVTLTNVQGAADSDNYITVKAGAVTDTSGNTSKAVSSSKFTMSVKDTTPPTVTISKPNPTSVYAGDSVTYTVYFDDDIGIKAVSFNASYVILNGFTGTVSVTGSGNERRTVTITNVQGVADSDNYITVKAGAVTDTSGNTSKAATSSKFTIKIKDNTPPVINISNPNPNWIYESDTVEYTVYFSDDVGIKNVDLNSNYITLNGFTANVSVNGTGNIRLVTLSNIKGNIGVGKSISIKAGAATDTSGNKTAFITSPSFEIRKKQEIINNDKGKDKIPPVVKIEAPNPKAINNGGKVTYKVTFSDNVGVVKVNLNKTKIKLVGFTADVSVKVNGVRSAIITLKNVKGNAGVNKYIKIDSGVALDKAGNRSEQAISQKFIINEAKKVKTTKTVYKSYCTDDLKLLGDINKEINYFASWLRAEKYTASYVQENNYVAEDERMTYMVEYYNGSTTVAKNVSFNLTIPYKVDVEEISGNGKITKRDEKETIITWNIGDVPSYVASNAGSYCRLYVRVRFLENELLEQSDNISEVFYAELLTKANEELSYSYMRQLFIDKTEGKTGLYKSYLITFDTTNEARPDDEITRAEFVKLIADSGLIEINVGSDKYKEFKDYKEIPSYARDAISALYEYGIIEAYSDETFKPNNPIITDDALEIIAKLARYISDERLITYKPVFIYTDALIGRDKKISEKKDYIMELMRENVIPKYNSSPDSYLLRKKAVEILNSLSFRGPYVELLPENTLKFVDIRNEGLFFYNIVGASNSYRYTYDYRLWQQIVEIE